MLTPLTSIGPYRILEKLGEGGMGVVYLGRDTRLNRAVALKALPAHLADDPDRLARFEREARTLASLSHPGIAGIYGLEEAGGQRYLVLEYVDGETLDGRLARGPLPVDDALDIAGRIAEALEAAHEKGIIHRDLKPGNIMVTPDGAVKVLDFGLARASGAQMPGAASTAAAPTLTSPGTQPSPTIPGAIMGTAGYMSPEQARGKPVDRRTDIFSFGCILYELLTGVRPFKGETVSDLIGAVLHTEVDVGRLPPGTPPAVVKLLQRTLVKDPKRRLQSIGDARLEIEDARAGDQAQVVAERVGPRRSPVALAPAALAGGVVVALALFAATWTRSPAPPATSAGIRASIALPNGLHLDGTGPPALALSADGSTLAFIAREASGPQRLYVRALDADTATLVPGSDTVEGPMFSPNGRWVAFAVGVSGTGGMPPELRKYSLETGLTQTIAPVEDYFGGVWLDDGSIVFVNAQPHGLWKVDAGGGEPRQVVAKFVLDGQTVERPVAWPAVIPGRRSLVVTDWVSSRVGHLAIVDLESGVMTHLQIEGSGGQVLPNGYLAYASPAAALMAVPLDTRTGRVGGTPVALVPDIAFGRNNVPAYAFSDNGTVVFATGYLPGSRREPMRLVRATREGVIEALPYEPDLLYRGFTLSPDGTRLVVGAWDGSRLLFDLRRGTRVALEGSTISEPLSMAWSPDGRRLAVTGPLEGRGLFGLNVGSLDEPGRFETLVEMPSGEINVSGWTPDGALIAWGDSPASGTSIFRLGVGQPLQTIAKEAGAIVWTAISPDGQWLAFDVTKGGPFELLVMPLDGKGARVAVSARGGHTPRWSRDGRQLFFRRDGAVLAVEVEATAGDIHFGPERRLFEWDVAREYDVSPSGEFYSMQPVPGAAQQTSIQLRTRWFEEVERVVRR